MIADRRSQRALPLRTNSLSVLTLDLPGLPALFREHSGDDSGLAVPGGLARFFALVFEVDCYL